MLQHHPHCPAAYLRRIRPDLRHFAHCSTFSRFGASGVPGAVHLKLRSFIVVELKVGTFRPDYVGKMNFYLSAVDDLLRHPSDQPSIGLILCRSKEGIVVEYALRDIGKPMGIAEFRLTESLPESLKSTLPSIEELESELDARTQDDGTSHEPSSGT
ncbi:MAG: PDDEXK nuclease domain-containing protein [Bryobacterales bacterium]|nr:PDDEXK nuclease domain-containing protein [Bryobacterales bacterium]